MSIREGRWDCPRCGSTGILGRSTSCPGCGDPRPEGVRFYLPRDESEVTDGARLAQAKAGADWICAFCGSSNVATAEACGGCGAVRGSSKSQAERRYDQDSVPRDGREPEPADATAAGSQRDGGGVGRARPRARRLLGCGGAGCVLVVALSVCGALVLLLGQKTVTARPQSFSWERTIEVEKLATVTESDWAVPSGGRVKRQERAIHHHDRVLDHYESRSRQVSEQVQTGTRTYVCGHKDLGNGYFEDVECTDPVYESRDHTESYQEPVYREEPVYQTRYTYEIDRWTATRTARATGDDREPRWPDVALQPRERAGKKSEGYRVSFADGSGVRYEWEPDLTTWDGLDPGQTYALVVTRPGNHVLRVEAR